MEAQTAAQPVGGDRGDPDRRGRLVAGRYRLDRLLFHGTSGAIWIATDELLGRQVALKKILLSRDVPSAAEQELRDLTLRGARALAQLSSPYVVTIYDILPSTSTGPVLVMEYVDGRSLADLIRDRGRLTPGQVGTVGVALASALLAVHEVGVVHRDVKPANVLVATDGRVKLTDFGIARRMRPSLSASPTSAGADDAASRETGARHVRGSPAYLAPELAAGVEPGPATDAWSLGGTLFAAVEGHPPFASDTAQETFRSVLNDPVPPAPHAGPLTPVINGLLVKSPALRMSVSQALELLRPVADDPAGLHLRWSPDEPPSDEPSPDGS